VSEERTTRRILIWIIGATLTLLLIGGIGILVNGVGPTHSPHRNAWKSLRDIASAEAHLREHDRDDDQIRDYWVGDVSQLYLRKGRGEQIRLIERSIAMADASPSAPLPDTCSRAAYWFRAMTTDEAESPYDRGGGHNPAKFGFCAYPEQYRSDGMKFTFIVNEQGIIWKKDVGGASVLQWPKSPTAEGWVKVVAGTDL